jgi:hypothetical protein
MLVVAVVGCVHYGEPHTEYSSGELRAPDTSEQDAAARAIEADPARWAAVVSGRVCEAQLRRSVAQRELAAAQDYAARGAGVLDLHALNNWQLELRAADDSEAAARAALDAHGFRVASCGNTDAELVERCMLLPRGLASDPRGQCRTPAAQAAVRVASLAR